ncbi:thioredoxin domain-containing protein, partial [Salmonella enterica subsp. enterica serovar Enteritidis]|nr:thioredoxin domain-containing protein [Salmonella enterica subsp. enterica serovar Enteritidis]
VQKGMPLAKATACLTDTKAVDLVAQRAGAANKAYAVNSTPTFLINGVAQANTFTWAALEPLVRAAVAK